MTKRVRRAALLVTAPVALAAIAGCPKSPLGRIRSHGERGMVLTSSGEAAAPRLILGFDPVYPRDARRRGEQGTVTVAISVEWNGRVADATIVEGKPPFDAAVLDAVRGWRFEELWHDGRPRSWKNEIRFRFDGASAKTAPVTDRDLPYFPPGRGPKLVERSAPRYPRSAKRRKIEDVLTVEVVVGDDGIVKDAWVVEGEPALASAAVRAVKKWRFEWHTSDWRTTVEVPFRIRYYYKIPAVATWRIKPSGPVPPASVQFGDAFAIRMLPGSWEDVALLDARPSHVHRELPSADAGDASVSVHLVVGTSGRVADARITRSAGAYDDAVLRSVATWQFEALRMDRTRIAWRTTATLHFRTAP
jgi:TonB family protein